MAGAKLHTKGFFSSIESSLRDHLTRNLALEIPAHQELDLYGRPGESAADFEVRCRRAADDAADAELAKLRDKYEPKVTRLRDQIAAADDRVDVLEEEASSRRNTELLSTAGSILGGLLSGRSRSSVLGKLGTAAGRRGRTKTAGQRLDAAENKVARLQEQLADLEAELADEVAAVDARWAGAVDEIETLSISLERSDVAVTQLALAWLPVGD